MLVLPWQAAVVAAGCTTIHRSLAQGQVEEQERMRVAVAFVLARVATEPWIEKVELVAVLLSLLFVSILCLSTVRSLL